MNKIDKFIEKNIKVNIEPITAIGTFSIDFPIKVPGYPSRYLQYNEIYYKGESVDEDTELDVDALGLKEIPADDDWKDDDVTSLIVIPKGSKVELYFDPKNYNEDYEQFTTVTIKYNGIKIIADVDDELDEIFEDIDTI